MKCVMCGTKHFLQKHHVVPLSKGGKDDLTNKVVICIQCHRRVHGRKSVGKPRNFSLPRERKIMHTIFISGKTLELLNPIKENLTYDEAIYKVLKPLVDEVNERLDKLTEPVSVGPLDLLQNGY